MVMMNPAFAHRSDRSARPLILGVVLAVIGLLSMPSHTPRASELTVNHELVGEALHAADLKDWTRALALMERVDEPLAAKYLYWFRLVNKRADAKFDDLARFIIDNPTWPGIDDLQDLAEARLTDSADQTLTLDLFRNREPQTTRGRVRLAEALFASGADLEAVKQVKTAWVEGEFTAKEEASFLRRHERHLDAQDHQARMEAVLWARQWRSVRRMLPRVSNAYQKLAEARLALQQQSPGVDRAIEAVPAALVADSGLAYDRTRWRRLKGKHTGAVELLLQPPATLVRAERWWFERSYQIRRAIDLRDFETAYQLASHHGQENGSDYVEAEWLAGWLALRFNNRPKTAFRHFVRLYDRVQAPVRQARAAYWAGRAAVMVGDQAGGTAWYRRAMTQHATYYGQLAAEELQQSDLVAPPVSPRDSDRTNFAAREVVQVATLLIAAGATNHLDPFLLALAGQAEAAVEISLISDLAIAGGRPSLLAQLGRRAAFDGNVYSPAAFPVMRIQQLLDPAADGVEPPLLFALARQESMFRNKAASGAGARGLMQLLPSTAEATAKREGETFDLDRLVGDFNYNAMLGGHYMESVLKRFDGELVLAIAAYNAGPYRINQWLKKHGDPREGGRHAIVDWVELIPYEETRNYVQRVMEGYHVYKRHLADSTVAVVDYHGHDNTYPPPMPVTRPSDTAALIADDHASGRQVIAEPLHRPAFKPLDHLAETYDTLANQHLAADESPSRSVID